MRKRSVIEKSEKLPGGNQGYYLGSLATENIQYKRTLTYSSDLGDRGDDGNRWSIVPIDPFEQETTTIARIWLREMLNSIAGDRERWIAELYFVHELNMQEIGNIIGLTRERIRQLLKPVLLEFRAAANEDR